MRNSNAAEGQRTANGTLARTAVVACVLLMFGLMAVLWRQWSHVPEPTTAIVVNADPSLEGCKVEVRPLDDESQSKPADVTLSRDNGYRTAIYRYPGHYHVTITVPTHDKPLWEGDITVDRLHAMVLDLPTTITVVGDSSLAGDQVTFTSDDGRFRQTQTFTREGNYRLRFILMSAHFTMSVTRDGTVILTDSLTVQQHTPDQIDLRKI